MELDSSASPRIWRLTECNGAKNEDELLQKLAIYGNEGTVNNVQIVHNSTNELWAIASFTCLPPRNMQDDFEMDDKFVGLTPLHDGVDPIADIIVVPGLGTHPLGSFRSKRTGKIWLCDWLPRDIPEVRILLYGYQSDLFSSSSRSSIKDLARAMLHTILSFRKTDKTSSRPAIFIAHSLGGLLVKEALALAFEHSEIDKPDPSHSSFFASTSAMLFFGVPNLGLRANKLGAAVKGQPNATLIHDVEVDNDSEPTPFLKELGQRFRNCFAHHEPSFDVVSYYERHLSPTLQKEADGRWARTGPSELLVTEDSACRVGLGNNSHHEYPLEADHSGIVKYDRRFNSAYQNVLQSLKDQIERAPERTRLRFAFKTTASSGHSISDHPITRRIDFDLGGVPVVGQFIERDAEMQRLNTCFDESRPGATERRTVVVLYGMGGIGKTQLAIEYARTNRKRYTAIFWLNSASEDRLKESFLACVRRLPEPEISGDLRRQIQSTECSPDFAVKTLLIWLSESDNQDWLLIFDNFDRDFEGASDPSAYDVRKYFPGADHGSILITSRLASLQRITGKGLHIAGMNHEQAKNTLETNANRQLHDAQALVDRLGGLPLALTQAGSYLRETNMSIETYLTLYDRTWDRVVRRQDEFTPVEYHHDQSDRGLFTTWMISYEQVRSKSESAAMLLRFWALLDREDVWSDWIQVLRLDKERTAHGIVGLPIQQINWLLELANDDPMSLDSALALLSRYSLVEKKIGAPGHSIHPVLHEWSFHLIESKYQAPLLFLAMSPVCSNSRNDSRRESWRYNKRMIPHTARLYHVWSNHKDKHHFRAHWQGSCLQEWTYLYSLCAFLQRCGKNTESRVIRTFCVEHLEGVYQPETHLVLKNAIDLSISHLDSINLEDSQMVLEKVHSIRLQLLGPENGDTCEAAEALAAVYSLQNKPDQAEQFLRLSQQSQRTLSVLNRIPRFFEGLSIIYEDRGDLEQAEQILKHAVVGFGKTYGEQSVEALTAVHNLAFFYHKRGNPREAEKLLSNATKTWTILDLENNIALNCLCQLGRVYWQLDSPEMAKNAFTQVLNSCKCEFPCWHLFWIAKSKEILKWIKVKCRIRKMLIELCHKEEVPTMAHLLSKHNPPSFGSLANSDIKLQPIERFWYCDNCGLSSLSSLRFRCTSCPDFDLDEECFALLDTAIGCHEQSHLCFATGPASTAATTTPKGVAFVSSAQYREMLGVQFENGVLVRKSGPKHLPSPQSPERISDLPPPSKKTKIMD